MSELTKHERTNYQCWLWVQELEKKAVEARTPNPGIRFLPDGSILLNNKRVKERSKTWIRIRKALSWQNSREPLYKGHMKCHHYRAKSGRNPNPGKVAKAGAEGRNNNHGKPGFQNVNGGGK